MMQSKNNIQSDEDDGSSSKNTDWCGVHSSDDDTAPLPADEDDPSFVVSGSQKDVEVRWKPNSYFKQFDYGNVYAVAFVGGTRIMLNEKQQNNITDFILMHELAHTLGYNHGDGGIVNIDVGHSELMGDRSSRTMDLEPSTTDVATTFDAYRFIDRWGITELGHFGHLFALADCGIKQLSLAGQNFSFGFDPEDVLIKHSHDGMGGRFDTGFRSNPTNIMAGHLYTEDGVSS